MSRPNRKFLFICILSLLLLTPTYSSNSFTIAAYNVENLFDLQKDGNEYKEYVPFTHDWNLDNFHKKLKNISDVICAINAEIIILSEIENQNVLKSLKKELFLKSCNYKFLAIGNKPNKTTTNVALLSKFPISNVKCHSIPKIKKYFTRNILETDISINGHILKVFSIHWPSKKHPESYRLATAIALKDIISKLNKNCDYIITGDFNSNYNEAETFFTTGHDDTNGKTGINHILNTSINLPYEPLCFFRPEFEIKDSSKSFHYNPWIDVSSKNRFSYIYKGSKNSLDHILLSEGLFDSLGISYIDNSFKAFHWNGKLFKNEKPYRWEMTRTNNGIFHTGKGYSDHLPVIAKFNISPYETKTQKDPICIKYKNPKTVCGFESGVEGWISMSQYASIKINSTISHSGTNSLQIYGKTDKNSKVAKISIKPPKFITSRMSLMIKGQGKIAVIINQKDRKSISYSGSNFNKKSYSTKYTGIKFEDWNEINLPLSDLDINKKWDLTIKSYKDETLNLFLDNIQLK